MKTTKAKKKSKVKDEKTPAQMTLMEIADDVFPHIGERGQPETITRTVKRIISERNEAGLDAAYYRMESNSRAVMVIVLSVAVIFAAWKIRNLRSILP